jgi:hypothetical protein
VGTTGCGAVDDLVAMGDIGTYTERESVCVCVCMCVSERKTVGHIHTQRHTQTHTHRDTNTHVHLLSLSLCALPHCAQFDGGSSGGPAAAQHGLWFHVDAAWAGSACICPEYRPLLRGIDRATSYNFNMHKWLLTNFDCSLLWCVARASLCVCLSASVSVSVYAYVCTRMRVD